MDIWTFWPIVLAVACAGLGLCALMVVLELERMFREYRHVLCNHYTRGVLGIWPVKQK